MKIYKSIPNGIINSTPSKSYGHRFIIASALSSGESNINNVVMSDDIKATLNMLPFLNKDYIYENNNLKIINKENNINDHVIDCNQSGSTLRFLIPIMLSFYDNFTFRCKPSLLSRGLEVYFVLFSKLGIETSIGDGYIRFNGKLRPGEYIIPGNISSQYITGLLFALPLLNGDSKLIIDTKIESVDYIKITLDVLAKYNIDIKFENNVFYIKGNQKYIANDNVVEGDYSNASFIDAFNYLGGNVKINNLNENSLQGDKKYKEYFKKISKGFCNINIKNQIDLGPVLMAFGAMFEGVCLTGTKRLEIKESNRAFAMQEELAKFNINCEIFENEIMVYKSNIKYNGKYINSHDDHRIVMAMCLFLTKFDILIDDFKAVNKSYPDYFKDLASLGVQIDYE